MFIHLADNNFNTFYTTSPVEDLKLFHSIISHQTLFSFEVPKKNDTNIISEKYNTNKYNPIGVILKINNCRSRI